MLGAEIVGQADQLLLGQSQLFLKRAEQGLAEIGQRLVATGYLVAVFAGMADIFGLGSHTLPEHLPFFGVWQALGVMTGQFLIAIGFVFLTPFGRNRGVPKIKS